MRIISIEEVGQAGAGDQVCRTSAIRDLVWSAIFLGLILLCLFFYIRLLFFDEDATSPSSQVFTHLVFLWFLFWFGIMLMLAYARAHACRLPSNWLLRVTSSGVLIKFRSFQNHYYADTDPVVIELAWRDISWMRKTRETNHRGQGDESMTEFFTYVDIKLDLDQAQLGTLADALLQEQRRKPPSSPVSSLRRELLEARRNQQPKHEIERLKSRIKLMKLHNRHLRKGGVKYDDVPVRLLEHAILRIRWNAVRPNIKAILKILQQHTRIDEATSITTDSSRDLNDEELDDMILERLGRGDRFEAIALVKSYRGLDTTRATEFIDELSGADRQQQGQ